MTIQPIPCDKFTDEFSSTTELSSVALGGKVLAVSDEFFAEAFHLLLAEPAPNLKGQFGPKGALYSGWESRRHNPSYDWCIIKLGSSGSIFGFDIDTTHFNGNEAPQASVDALFASTEENPQVNDPRWSEILPKVTLGPSSRHLFKIPETSSVNYVKLNMYPDGGIARFRVYGTVSPVFPADVSELFDLAHVFAGGRVVFTSDQHFGGGSNLILPGRGKDMGDGWETKRSRQIDHKDWVIIKLGAPGILDHAEIDTAHFMGNFPESCELHALNSPRAITTVEETAEWTPILSRTKLGPHRRHFFHLENAAAKVYTHVKLTIHPDGGVKRVRIIGRRASGIDAENVARTKSLLESDSLTPVVEVYLHPVSPSTIISTLPLTPEAFAPFGQVVQAYGDHNAAPPGTRITPANQGTASKFHKLALLRSSYPSETAATAGLSVYRCQPTDTTVDGEWQIKILERHPYTNQAFIPMGSEIPGSVGSDGLEAPGNSYLVVVAKNGVDDKPDLDTLRAFVASAAQGIVYDTAVWHQPMTVLGRAMDFTCVETQIGNDHQADCEVVELDHLKQTIKVKVV